MINISMRQKDAVMLTFKFYRDKITMQSYALFASMHNRKRINFINISGGFS